MMNIFLSQNVVKMHQGKYHTLTCLDLLKNRARLVIVFVFLHHTLGGGPLLKDPPERLEWPYQGFWGYGEKGHLFSGI